VRDFARGAPQSDDIALLALRFMPSAELKLSLRSTFEEAVRGYQAVEAFLSWRGTPPDAAGDVALAVEEVLTNVVRHGYKNSEGPIEVVARANGLEVTVEVRDRGVPFDPRSAPPPHLEVPLDERPTGDLGILLVRSAIDRIDYQREAGENVLVLVRDLTRTKPKE
jgi:anti-sigma regulatory factor (Ser/Thr protein kinase)